MHPSFHPPRRPLWAAIGLALLALAAGGCERAAPAEVVPPPPSVGVAHPLVQEIVEQDVYTGRLGPIESVDVRARVSGYVDSVHFTDGQLVNKGDLLYVIDPRAFVDAQQVADGEAHEAQSRLDIADRDFARAKNLVNTRAISQEDFDRRSKTAEGALASLETAKARAERARLDVEWTEVRAPMAGRISRHLVSVGNLVTGGEKDSTLLTNIVSVGAIYAYFDIDEQAYLRYLRADGGTGGGKVFQTACAVDMSVLGETDFSHHGELNYVDNQIDTATGTLRARALFRNELNLSPGVFVDVRVAGSAPRRAVLIADRAVMADQSDRYVFVVGKDGLVKEQRVTLGRLFDGLRVVTAGLDGSETVVVDGVQRARPGSAVQPETVQLSLAGSDVNLASTDAGTAGGDVR
jgi:RND family efflux transporter MFP subunit